MSALLPVEFTWTGDAMQPAGRFTGLCDRQFVIGERYILVEHEARSAASHAHYFACVRDGWSNLPEHLADRFPTPDHLRKWALIRTGFRDEVSFVASSKAEAVRIAAFLRPVDDTAVVRVKDSIIVRWTAKSQSMRAMGKEDFQRSKDAVLAVIDELIGTAAGTLSREAGRAA
ncbi:hypothetical protein VQ03_28980 [Methylobacterium tarhaniae]|uniref:Uncharacterized protein n=1 Tax=Methylobacterium tarhaniae TaxID=1187852 RepID=A0A0J6S8D3_9HYPH|nr:hypothetical protein [Methylobacterium tarhaniae]KMO29907.1 hypothetical protein VQ03_28980 [Methylobacterium tarhaniae]